MTSVEECVESERRSLNEYVSSSEEWMLRRAGEVLRVNGVERVEESKDEYKRRIENERKEKVENASLMGKFFRDVKEILHKLLRE